jgi:hypothetical protein
MHLTSNRTFPRAAVLLSALAFAGALAAGCSQTTLIRRTALVPTPNAPLHSGFQLAKGEVAISGVLDSASPGTYTHGTGYFFRATGVEGDPGVLLPRLQLGLDARVGMTRGFEVGAFVRYAAHDWAEPNVAGVLAFPDDDAPDIWSGGVGARLRIPTTDERLHLSFSLDILMTEVAEAVFVCVDRALCATDTLVSDVTAEQIYAFQRVDREFFILPQLVFQLGFAPIPEVMPWMGFGLATSVTNTGFENDPFTLPDDSLETYGMGWFALGVDTRIDALTINGAVYLPFGGESRISFGPMLSLKVGGRFGGAPR